MVIPGATETEQTTGDQYVLEDYNKAYRQAETFWNAELSKPARGGEEG